MATQAGNLSGRRWWHANQARYPESDDLNDLRGEFRDGVIRFIGLLRSHRPRVQVRVITTRRHAIRAYLMHYSWAIANEEMDPADVPARRGVTIQWNHGNLGASRRGAREMVNLFSMAGQANLRSNHLRGLAIDMAIHWRGDLFFGPLPDGSFRGIVGGPRNGNQNRDLHAIGALYGVHKLRGHPSHWSFNGR